MAGGTGSGLRDRDGVHIQPTVTPEPRAGMRAGMRYYVLPVTVTGMSSQATGHFGGAGISFPQLATEAGTSLERPLP